MTSRASSTSLRKQYCTTKKRKCNRKMRARERSERNLVAAPAPRNRKGDSIDRMKRRRAHRKLLLDSFAALALEDGAGLYPYPYYTQLSQSSSISPTQAAADKTPEDDFESLVDFPEIIWVEDVSEKHKNSDSHRCGDAFNENSRNLVSTSSPPDTLSCPMGLKSVGPSWEKGAQRKGQLHKASRHYLLRSKSFRRNLASLMNDSIAME